MPEKRQQPNSRGKRRKERIEYARSRDILDVAHELNMELFQSGRDYRWKDHDSLVITPEKNVWKWFSQNLGGDTISLVETIKGINFNQTIDFLNDGQFKEFSPGVQTARQEAFRYYLEPYEQPFKEAREYLKEQRGLSDATIDFFLEKGVLAQANAKLNDSIEPVVVFKSLDFSGEIVGANLQGIEENWSKWPTRGRAKNIIRNSDGTMGLHIDIGQPKRLIFSESPIDLMSYYEINKERLQDVRLVSMDGLKEAVIGRHISQLQSEVSGRPLHWSSEELAKGLDIAIDNGYFSAGKHRDMITLAVDNDEGGRNFVSSLQGKGVPVRIDVPPITRQNLAKADWNEYLNNPEKIISPLQHIYSYDTENERYHYEGYFSSELAEEKVAIFKQKPLQAFSSAEQLTLEQLESLRQEGMSIDNSRLAQSKRKLERLERESLEAIDEIYSHQKLTNGQPMNDKRGGASFFRKQEQIEQRARNKVSELEAQRERVERLEAREERKQRGLNRNGSGLDISVQNIPRIREEIEKYARGESVYTRETIKRYQTELVRLEAVQEKVGHVNIQPAAQTLIDDGVVNQWQKSPDTYFVKGLRRVALELTEEGIFKESEKYRSRTPEEKVRVEELLNTQNIAEDKATDKEQPIESKDLQIQVRFEFSESAAIRSTYAEGEIIPYQEFASVLYRENELATGGLGYYKTYFDLQTEQGETLVEGIRYDVGTENELLSEQFSEYFSQDYLKFAYEADLVASGKKQEETEYLSTVSRADLPENIQANSSIQELLGQVEHLGETAYFWVTEEDLEQPKEIVSQLDDWFSSGKVDEVYKSDRFELTTGDYTYMIEFKDGDLSLQNMEDYAKYISKQIEINGVDSAISELKEVISDFNQVKDSISLGMNELLSRFEKQPFQIQEEIDQLTKEEILGTAGETEFLEISISQIQEDLSTEGNLIGTPQSDGQMLYTQVKDIGQGYQLALAVYSPEMVDSLEDIQAPWTVAVIKDDKNIGYLAYGADWGNEFQITDELERFAEATRAEMVSDILYRSEDVALFLESGQEAEVVPDNQKAPDLDNQGQQKNDRINVSKGSLQPEAEGSAIPVLDETSTVELAVTSHPTLSSRYLYFNTEGTYVSRVRRGYHVIDQRDLSKLNNFAPMIQEMANWYREELSSSDLLYVVQNGSETDIVRLTFEAKNFPHLTGILPVGKNQTSEKTLHDFADGNGNFENILIAQQNNTFKKLGVLPNLKSILDPKSFYFDDLDDIKRFNRMDVSKAIQSDDKDILLAFRTTEENISYPASLLKVKGGVKTDLESSQRKVVLGIYRERDGKIEQIAVNEEHIHDNGEEMMSILKNKQYESSVETPSMQENENPQATSYDYQKEVLSGLNEDMEFKVRFLRSENEELAGKYVEGDILPYRQFAEEIYRENQKAGAAQETRFDILTPDEDIILESFQYDIGTEKQVISKQVDKGQEVVLLSKIDETVLSQLKNQAVPISAVNEQISELSQQQVPPVNPIKQGLEKRVDQILQQSNQVREKRQEDGVQKDYRASFSQSNTGMEKADAFNYMTASAYDLSQKALESIREYTRNPEDMKEYLDFMSKFPNLSPRNVALIQKQWPGADAVATYDQWQALGKALGIEKDDVLQTSSTFTNKRTGKSREVPRANLSVKFGEKAKITLFRPEFEKMIPVLDENGYQLKNSKGNPQFKPYSKATPQEEALVKEKKIEVRKFQKRNPKTGQALFSPYKVFELSQTTLKPESYPKLIQHYNFDLDQVKTKEVLDGLNDYAKSIGVTILQDETHAIGNARGAFYPYEQKILLNPSNTPGEKVSTTIHELAHASLHNPKGFMDLPTAQMELEAEMTSYLVSNHFGLDTSNKTIGYIASWTDNLKQFDDKQLSDSLKRIHKTSSKIVKEVEKHTKPYQMGRQRGQSPNFPQAPTRGPKL